MTHRPEVTDCRVVHSIPDVMEATGLSRDFIYKEIRAGKLDARKAGKRTLILNLSEYVEALPRMETAEDEAAAS